jgi:hypothetical protein
LYLPIMIGALPHAGELTVSHAIPSATEPLAVAGAPVALRVAAALPVGSANLRTVFLQAAIGIVTAALAIADRVVGAALVAADALPIATADIRAPRPIGRAALALMAGAVAAKAIATDRFTEVATFAITGQAVAIRDWRRRSWFQNRRPGVSAPGGICLAHHAARANHRTESQHPLDHTSPRCAIGHRLGHRIESPIVHRAAMPFQNVMIESGEE